MCRGRPLVLGCKVKLRSVADHSLLASQRVSKSLKESSAKSFAFEPPGIVAAAIAAENPWQ